jgi:hypothetical protein
MTSTQRTAISSPAVGLIVYQTDSTEGLYQYKGTGGWTVVGGGGGGTWGTITGTLSSQTDLQSALDARVPYTGATANVDLGTHRILAQNATIASSGSGDTFTLNHSSGSGIGLNITKGGNGEGLYINKTSGSGNAATIIGTLNATTLVKSGGTSSQFLKADGSVDSTTYIGGSGATGQVAYWNGTNSQTGSNNLFWDSFRLGIGTNTPASTYILDVVGLPRFRNNVTIGNISTPTTIFANSNFIFLGSANINSNFINVGDLGLSQNIYFNGTNNVYNRTQAGSTLYLSGDGDFRVLTAPSGSAGATATLTERFRLFNTGNLLLQAGGTFTDSGQRLQVQGTALVSGNLTAASFIRSGGTSAQILAADGSVITAGTNITISGGTISSSGGGGGTTIYTGDGTLAGDRTVTNSTFLLKFVGGKEILTNEQTALRLETSTTGKELIFSLNNLSGKNWLIRSLSSGNLDFRNITNSLTGISINGTTGDVNVYNNLTSALNHFILGVGQFSIRGLWLGKTAANAANYSICENGTETIVNSDTGGLLRFRIGNVDKMMLTNAGRLLLGTTTESTFLLDVNGTARFVSANNNNYNSIRVQPNNLSTILDIGWAGIQTNQIFTLDSGSNNIYIGTSSASRLGIGTTAPSVKAEIRGTTTAATTIGTEEEFKITRLTTADGSYPQAVSFALGTYENNGAGNDYGPKTRFDIKLKSTQSDNVTTNLTVITFLDNNTVGINNTAPNASSLLDLTSTTKGFLPPRMTTTQKNAISSPAAGLMVFDTTLVKLCVYNGTTWETITSI